MAVQQRAKMNKQGGIISMVGGIVLVGLFALALMTFAAQMALNNEAESILDDPALEGINDTLRERLSETQTESQTQREVLEGQEAVGGVDEGFGLTAIVGAVYTFMGMGIAMFNVVFLILANTLGIPPLVFNVLFGLAILTLVILAWAVWKIGGK